MRRRTGLALVVIALACVVTPGCAGLADWLDELGDDSLECAKEAQKAYSACMAAPDDPAAPTAGSDGLVHMP